MRKESRGFTQGCRVIPSALSPSILFIIWPLLLPRLFKCVHKVTLLFETIWWHCFRRGKWKAKSIRADSQHNEVKLHLSVSRHLALPHMHSAAMQVDMQILMRYREGRHRIQQHSGIYGALPRQFCCNDQPRCPNPRRLDTFRFTATVKPAKAGHMYLLPAWVAASRSSISVFTIQPPFRM